MGIVSIKAIYNEIKNLDNLSKKRAILHQRCDDIDFNKLLEYYDGAVKVTELINYIKNEYEKMIEMEKSVYKISDKELEVRIQKLKLVADIYENCSNPYMRLDKMLKLFKNPSIMQKSYILLIKNSKQDPKLAEIQPLLRKFDIYYNDFYKIYKSEIHKSIDNAYQDNNDYYQTEYAFFIISEYIKEKDSYLFDKFLSKYNISADDFYYFLTIVRFKHQLLYNMYINKKRYNAKMIDNYNKNMFDDLAYAIKNGEFVYGNKFDLLEFIKYVPFKNSHSFINDIEEFLTQKSPLIKDIIIKYIKENHLDNQNNFKPISFDIISKAKVTINNHVIENNTLQEIIDYLVFRNVPICKSTIRIACEKYLNNDLILLKDKAKILYKNENPIIIPTSKKVSFD